MTPFPHSVTDGAWDSGLLGECVAEFDHLDRWQWFRNPHEHKDAMTFAQAHEDGAEACWRVREILNGREYIETLEALTGLDSLVFDELGGGLHSIPLGGFLDPHIDFNENRGRWRRVNVLIFLNRGWPDDSGNLNLYDSSRVLAKSVRPEFNRTVTFICGETSWHGHPTPTTRVRRSLAAYYFTNSSPPDPPHDTIWMAHAR